MANQKQIRMIHILKSKLGMDDNNYRALLSGYGVSTSTALSEPHANGLIDALVKIAKKTGVWETKKREAKADRPGMANDAQIRKIRAMWSEVSRAPDSDSKMRALDVFVSRFGVDRLCWLPAELVPKVIKAISVMQQKERISNVNQAVNGKEKPADRSSRENGSGSCAGDLGSNTNAAVGIAQQCDPRGSC